MMKKKKILTAIVVCFALSILSSTAQKKAPADMFPEAGAGYQKVIIQLPERKNEDNYKLELFVGRTMEVDVCNRHFMTGKILEETLQGWGYTYYKVETNGQTAGTLMMCPDNSKKMKFVHMQSVNLRYNSKLPIVVYVPDSIEVKYKLWKAGRLIQP